MAAIDDLKAAVAAEDVQIGAVLTGLQNLAAEITALLAWMAANPASNDPAIETIVTDLQAKTAAMGTALTAALATIPPPAA